MAVIGVRPERTEESRECRTTGDTFLGVQAIGVCDLAADRRHGCPRPSEKGSRGNESVIKDGPRLKKVKGEA